jgi:hypothetical protein
MLKIKLHGWAWQECQAFEYYFYCMADRVFQSDDSHCVLKECIRRARLGCGSGLGQTIEVAIR